MLNECQCPKHVRFYGKFYQYIPIVFCFILDPRERDLIITKLFDKIVYLDLKTEIIRLNGRF